MAKPGSLVWLLCLLVACEARNATEEANAILDRILEESNKHIVEEIYIPGPISKVIDVGFNMNITVFGMNIKRESNKTVRIGNATLGTLSPDEDVLYGHVNSGKISVEIKHAISDTSLTKVSCSLEVTFDEIYKISMKVDKEADCTRCEPKYFALDLGTPQLTRFHADGFFTGKITEMLVWHHLDNPYAKKVLSAFFDPALHEIALKPLQPAVKRHLCKCSKRS